MKRDMEVIREILISIEENSEPELHGYLTIDGIENGITLHHQHLLIQAGFITAIEAGDANTRYGFELQNASLTWEGHEFLATIRDNDVWRQTKKGASKIGGWSVSILSELAKGYVKQKAIENGFPMGL